MKQQVASYTETSLPSYKQTKQSLYNNYAGMLLGYILEVVNNRTVAEQYLVDLFNNLQPTDMEDIMQPGVNAYCSLQQLARKKLSEADNNTSVTNNNSPIRNNKYIGLMSPDQQAVFRGIHYQRKTIAQLASELNKPESAIRQLLKESFTLIRNNP